MTQPAGGAPEIYLDVETLRLSHEVRGGWSSIRQFGLAVAVTWDAAQGFRHWYEPNAPELVAELETFARVVTFNGERFDFEVLRGYVPVHRLPERSLDLMVQLERRLGHRVRLNDLARETLGVSKTGSGLEAATWWRSGQRDKVLKYCEQDVQLLIDLVAFARRNGYVVVDGRRIPMDWR